MLHEPSSQKMKDFGYISLIIPSVKGTWFRFHVYQKDLIRTKSSRGIRSFPSLLVCMCSSSTPAAHLDVCPRLGSSTMFGCIFLLYS